MADYDTRESESEYEGCLTALDVVVENGGDLTIDELESIDSVMLEFGTERTGQRLSVSNQPDMVTSRAKYVYQETLLASSFDRLIDRLQYLTDVNLSRLVIGTEVVDLR
jgi:hypothetical protein